MNSIDRRTFMKTTGATFAATVLAAAPEPARAAARHANAWKKAFMLGVTRGPILPHFQRLRDAGFEGVELLSPNELDRDEVLRARDKTGLVIHGVSGSRHWKDPLSHPDPQVVERGMAAIRHEMADCKAYGGSTVLLVPAVVNKEVSYRDAYTRSQANIRKLIPDAERHGVKIALEEVWNISSSALPSSPGISTSSRAPGSSPTSTSATSSNTATPNSGFASSASASEKSTSRSTPSRSGSIIGSARRGARSTGPQSARR